jgi:cytoskeletal protein CcmA (bactofilin family)
MKSFAIVAGLFLTMTSAAAAESIAAYGIFGNSGVAIGQGSTVTGGLAGSNDTVRLDPLSNFDGLAGGGELAIAPLGAVTVNGNILFNGGVATGQFTNVRGTIDSGGDVAFGPGATSGNITATGGVNLPIGAKVIGNVLAGGNFLVGDLATVQGNVGTNGNAIVNGTVTGNLTHAGTLTLGPFGSLGSQNTGMVVVNPARFMPVTVPSADTFTAGGPNLTSGGSLTAPLAPGRYGSLTLAVLNDLYLTAGDYFFTSINLQGSQTIHLLNLSAGRGINIFVTGDVTEGALVDTKVNEQPFSAADAALAANVFWETLGRFTQAPLGADHLFGTVFAPNDNITFGQFTQVTGAVISGAQISTGPGFLLNYVPSAHFLAPVPEPPALALLGLGVLGLLGYGWRRQSVAIPGTPGEQGIRACTSKFRVRPSQESRSIRGSALGRSRSAVEPPHASD